MKGDLVLHIINIAGTCMIDSGINGLYRGKQIGGMMRNLNPLQFLPLGQGAVERSDKLDPWLRSWWGDNLISTETSDLFEE